MSPHLFRIDTAVNDLARAGATVKLTGRTGAHVKLANGWTVSVQWSTLHYCGNKDHPDNGPLTYLLPARDSATAEVAAWDGDGDMVQWNGEDTVIGWQDWQQVQSILDRAEAGVL